MSDLAEFLLARIAEDEAVARAAIGHSLHISTDWEGAATQRHIYRWSSARVLAECEAKRQIVEEHELEPADYGGGQGCGICAVRCSDATGAAVESEGPCLTVRLLALPYADHEDYREEWKP